MIEPRFGCLATITQLWQLKVTGGNDEGERSPSRGLGQTCKVSGQSEHADDAILLYQVRTIAMGVNEYRFVCIGSRQDGIDSLSPHLVVQVSLQDKISAVAASACRQQ